MNVTKIKLPGVNDYFTEEAFNVLRTNIQFCGQNVKVIAITSCTMNEGKTVISMHIGRSLSELGKKVLVIDADMRKSVMAGRNSDAKDVKGLSEVVTGQADRSDCIYQTQYENLHVMFSGQYPPNPVELLDGEYFDNLLDYAKRNYDYVIIDTPPLGMVIDAAVVAAKCDSALVVLASNRSKYTVAQEVINQLQKSGCNVLGVVLNNVDNKGKGYYSKKKGYGYGYGYYANSSSGKKSSDKAEKAEKK